MIAMLVAVLLSASGSQTPIAGEEPVTVQLVEPDRKPALPAGWRWESYGGVEVGIPGEWGWGDSGLRLDAWCVGSAGNRPPVVARPGGATPAIACGGDGTRIADTGWVVGLGHALQVSDGVERVGDRTTVRLAGVEVVVQAPWGLREQIAATVHRVDVDDFGCPTTNPISMQPALRPARPVDLATLRNVSSVSACKYELRQGYDTAQQRPWLVSSLHLDGAAAERAIRQIAQAPVGGGPDQPDLALPEAAYGDDAIVLRVRSRVGLTEVMLRYSGCDHNGFDDGINVRRLTAASVAPFIAGPNTVLMFAGPDEKIAMLSSPHPSD
ncbi:hypothetical protein [Krasilnikovia cinnamomea]|uniref:hypothetical protein n=1 Tax=Krasilnikovia cinnamomea TaxID=349313 RepID=UPI00102AA996|nr:hypothetical protein [Krasilnikovia cinnamomea]